MTLKHQGHRYAINTLAATAALVMGTSMLTTPATAQDFETTVAVRDLNKPMGITYTGVAPWVVISEVPTPGVPGDNGGENRVVLVNLKNGNQHEISFGEPEPVNLAIDNQFNLYWTCKSAGVILKRSSADGTITKLLTDLNTPSGLATAGQYVVFTEVPDPGNKNDMNTVKAYDGNMIMELSSGEPEPTDVAVASDGTVYWTCKSAGVILRRTPDGTKDHLLDGLNQPVGIALDRVGHLYFTEVPTPGVPGDEGGENMIWRYDLNSGQMDLVNAGDPEPTDITVTDNGAAIMWTCTSAGVIKIARAK